MEKFEFNSKKFMIILMVIFVAFFVLIIKAFEYLPEQDVPKVINESGINLPGDGEDKTANNDEVQEETAENATAGMPIKLNYSDNIPEIESDNVVPKDKIQEKLESLDEESAVESNKNETVKQDTVSEVMERANKYRDEKQYVKAIEEYAKVSKLTKEPAELAKSYEEIATIYAVAKRYGSALTYAQKAYNTYPTNAREILLARLYYKTGDVDTATKRINNVLHRDFSIDR